MKLIALLAVPSTALAASWTSLFHGAQLEGEKVSTDDMNGCIAHAGKFLTKPATKFWAIEKAVDACAVSKKVEDNNFVCPHYGEILNDAFQREPTDREFTAESFCGVAEYYVAQLEHSNKVPNMGKGSGDKFKVSKDCKDIVLASLSPAKALPASNAPDFWYALCMNQDCAHFLPSRTRWCTQNHAPTHSVTVCEAIRRFASDEVLIEGGEMKPDDVCDMYKDFVEDTYILTDAYMHCVHGRHHTKVPVPEDKRRALQSAKMKNTAGGHGIRDASGQPVKSIAAPAMTTTVFLGLAGVWASLA